MNSRSLIRFFCFDLFLFFIIQSCALGQPESHTAQNAVVCVTRSGTKYHQCSCSYLRNGSIEISLEQALERYTPCSVCKPDDNQPKLGTMPSVLEEGDDHDSEAEARGEKPAKQEKHSSKETAKSKPCSARTKSGTRCKRMTTRPSGKCFQHDQ